MKVQFSSRDDVSVLVIAGAVTLHDTSILKAGLTKLFGGGKKKIVLSLGQSEIAGEEVLRELATLEALAQSQSAAIAFGGLGPDIKRLMEKIAASVASLVFSTDDEAFAFIQKSSLDSGTADLAVLQKKLADKEKELAELRAKIAGGDSEEALKTRIQVADLVAKNRYLEEQLRVLSISRRVPPDADAVAEKISSLEAAIEALQKKGPAKAAQTS